MSVHTVVLIAALAALTGAFRVTRFFRVKRYTDSLERRQQEKRDLDERKHEDQ